MQKVEQEGKDGADFQPQVRVDEDGRRVAQVDVKEPLYVIESLPGFIDRCIEQWAKPKSTDNNSDREVRKKYCEWLRENRDRYVRLGKSMERAVVSNDKVRGPEICVIHDVVTGLALSPDIASHECNLSELLDFFDPQDSSIARDHTNSSE